MTSSFLEIFIIAFIAAAAGYAFLASWTPLFYRKKSWGQLSQNELLVKQGNATMENRIDLFFRSFFTSLFTFQVYLAALLLAGPVWLVSNYLM